MYILSAPTSSRTALRDPVEKLLKVQVLLHHEVPGHLFAVLFGGDEGVAVGPGVAVEEDKSPLVLVDDVLGETDVPLQHPADEAGLAPEAVVHGLHVGVVALEPRFHTFHSRSRSWLVRLDIFSLGFALQTMRFKLINLILWQRSPIPAPTPSTPLFHPLEGGSDPPCWRPHIPHDLTLIRVGPSS